METKRTNKTLILKGLRNLAISLVLMFIGPTLLYIAFSNQEKSTYVLVLIFSLLVCLAAIIFIFRGIRIIMEGLFND